MAADTPSGSPTDLSYGLQAIKQLRQLDDSATGMGSHPAVALLALKALLAAGKGEEAEAEGMGIVVHDAADVETCCAVLNAMARAASVRVTSLRVGECGVFDVEASAVWCCWCSEAAGKCVQRRLRPEWMGMMVQDAADVETSCSAGGP